MIFKSNFVKIHQFAHKLLLGTDTQTDGNDHTLGLSFPAK